MPTLSTELRNQLEKTCISARNLAELAAKAALEGLAVNRAKPDSHMTDEQKRLRNHLRARARQLGDRKHANDEHEIRHLAHECAYEHWHRMLFARFLAENNLLIEPNSGVAVSLDECKELAKEEKADLWALAGRYAQRMLPQIFRADDPLLQVPLAKEHQVELDGLVNDLPKEVFTATDSLGWCYQFWQAAEKKRVNDAGNKIGADELPAVTQLFTEDYMVDFLLDNTLGAWWAGKVLAANPKLVEKAKSEDELRRAVALPGVEWKYLRFIKEDGKWKPASGTFDGWPKAAKELKCLDPCCGSGHFEVAMFERMVALRMAEERLSKKDAVVAVLRDNIYGLEIDPRCTQIAAFNLALAAWKLAGYCDIPELNIACSGVAPNATKDDWLKLAGKSEKLQRGMERLYQLFQQAPILGSLINPHAAAGDLLVAAFHELQPLLEKALAQETKDDIAHEMAVTARGLAKAAEILAGQFTLAATNVPFLTQLKFTRELDEFIDLNLDAGKANLATAFIQRMRHFVGEVGTLAFVSPQSWWFLKRYSDLRELLLSEDALGILVRLGEKAFESPQAGGEQVGITIMFPGRNSASQAITTLDASDGLSPRDKAAILPQSAPTIILQSDQIANTHSIILFNERSQASELGEFATALRGVGTGDGIRFVRCFWEVPSCGEDWEFHQTTVSNTTSYGGMHEVILWQKERGELAELAESVKMLNHAAQNWRRGKPNWGKRGVVVSQMAHLPASIYTGNIYDPNCCAIVPNSQNDLPALWALCSCDEFARFVREINQNRKVEVRTFLSVPFDLANWKKVAAEKYPHGLPKPFSSDPTQWLFNGHPAGADQPLHVAVARLFDYQWPRQTGSSFPDCSALEADGLEKFADADGIVCIPSVRGEEPAAERLRKLLAAAYGKEWKPELERKLIKDSGSDADSLEEWLRNDFFEQHCQLFHQRPFVWHIWDGRKRDGFHVLVNYHKLGVGAKGKQVLESLTHSYLNDWINRQKDGVKRGEDGAEERLAAALELKQRLEAIIEGEPPFDIFVRWKPLAKQPIGWEPDINDGVRLNIRPFLASDLPSGKKGAGVLRSKPNVKWDKDRGKEPHRPKDEFPWFWSGSAFTGDRLNDVHLTNEQKRKVRG